MKLENCNYLQDNQKGIVSDHITFLIRLVLHDSS